MKTKYKLAVFDLDFTLWDAGGLWCDHLNPPFSLRDGQVFDQRGREVRLYKDVKDILNLLESKQIPMAVASKTMEGKWAEELLELHEINHHFTVKEMYPLSKLNHFRVIHEITEIHYEDMIFFDDEYGNIADISSLGVKCVHLQDGLNQWIFEKSMCDEL